MPIRRKYMDNIVKFFSRSSHFSTRHDAEHATLTPQTNILSQQCGGHPQPFGG